MAIGRTNAGSSGGGSGAVLTVTAPPGVTVTIIKDGKTKTMTANAQGIAVFKGLETGNWTVTIANETQTVEKAVAITADYNVVIAFFAANISVVYPAGSVCTCSNGNVSLSAPNTSGSHTFVVPSTGTWTVSCTDGSNTATSSVSITADGQSKSVELSYLSYVFKSGSGFDPKVYKKLETSTNIKMTSYTTLNYAVASGNASVALNSYANGNDFCPLAFDINLAEYKTMYVDATVTQGNGSSAELALRIGNEGVTNIDSLAETKFKPSSSGVRKTYTYSVDTINATKRIILLTWNGRKSTIHNIWFE